VKPLLPKKGHKNKDGSKSVPTPIKVDGVAGNGPLSTGTPVSGIDPGMKKRKREKERVNKSANSVSVKSHSQSGGSRIKLIDYIRLLGPQPPKLWRYSLHPSLPLLNDLQHPNEHGIKSNTSPYPIINLIHIYTVFP